MKNNIIQLENTIVNPSYTDFNKINSEDLDLLSSKLGIRYLIKQDEINIDSVNKVLKQIHYEQRLRKLQIELIKLQKYIIENKQRVIILFEGRDSAGKGGAIRRFMEHINPRHATEVALPPITDYEKGSWYFERYIDNLPKPGNLVFFNRSWYNRAIIDPVNGFCTQEEHERFMSEVQNFENMLIKDGVYLIKFYFSISKNEQNKRIHNEQENPLRLWKISDIDRNAVKLWDEYTKYEKKMFDMTSNVGNSWVVVHGNSKMSARIKAIEYVLSTLKYDN